MIKWDWLDETLGAGVDANGHVSGRSMTNAGGFFSFFAGKDACREGRRKGRALGDRGCCVKRPVERLFANKGGVEGAVRER
jgi:hypothetical protein